MITQGLKMYFASRRRTLLQLGNKFRNSQWLFEGEPESIQTALAKKQPQKRCVILYYEYVKIYQKVQPILCTYVPEGSNIYILFKSMLRIIILKSVSFLDKGIIYPRSVQRSLPASSWKVFIKELSKIWNTLSLIQTVIALKFSSLESHLK